MQETHRCTHGREALTLYGKGEGIAFPFFLPSPPPRNNMHYGYLLFRNRKTTKGRKKK